MSEGKHAPPPLLSCGIEIEFLVQYMADDAKDTHALPGLPDVVRISRELYEKVEKDEAKDDTPALNLVEAAIRQVLENAGVPVHSGAIPPLLKRDYPGDEGLPERRYRKHQKWIVKTDQTIKKKSKDGYGYAGMEIITPILDGSKASFDMVGYVVNLLCANFRISLNHTCGLHVHIGNGVRGFDRANIQRIAGLLYSADRLLAELHPPERRFSKYSLSIRERSKLAKGRKAIEFAKPPEKMSHYKCHSYIAQDVRFGEEPLVWRQMNQQNANVDAELLKLFQKTREPGCNDPLQYEGGVPLKNRSDASSTTATEDVGRDMEVNHEQNGFSPRKNRESTRLPIRTFTKEQEASLKAQVAVDEETKTGSGWIKADPDLSAWHGIHEIFSAPSSCAVDNLLAVSDDSTRTNYSIQRYNCWQICDNVESSPTVEFREAAASMNAAWITAWAKICCNLTTWAIHASVADYLDVIMHCHLAETKQLHYDVVDLLEEANLFGESKAAEERIKNNAAAWGAVSGGH